MAAPSMPERRRRVEGAGRDGSVPGARAAVSFQHVLAVAVGAINCAFAAGVEPDPGMAEFAAAVAGDGLAIDLDDLGAILWFAHDGSPS